MKKITINRIKSTDNITLSECFLSDFIEENNQINEILNVFSFKSVELPWRNNRRNVSCIPADSYEAIAINRGSNGDYAIWLQNVPGRSEILIHTANFVYQLQGCIAPGTDFKHLDRDGVIDIANSRKVMEELERNIPVGARCIVQIIDNYKISGNDKSIVTD